MNQEVRRMRYEHSHKKHRAGEELKDSRERWIPEETNFLQNKLELGNGFIEVMS